MDKPLHVRNPGNAFASGTLLASLDGKQTRLTFQGFRYREVYDFVDWANKIIESNNH